jgi:hypothetical protein
MPARSTTKTGPRRLHRHDAHQLWRAPALHLDRDSQRYKDIYKQRTATERINSQAKALGIERPHIRNGKAIANLNTLITSCQSALAQRIRNHHRIPIELLKNWKTDFRKRNQPVWLVTIFVTNP